MATSKATVFITVTGSGGTAEGEFLKDDCNCGSEYLPANLCPPKEPLEPCPVRPVGFIPLSEYDQDFKYPLASSRVPSSRKKLEGCGSCSPQPVEPDPGPGPCIPNWQNTGTTRCIGLNTENYQTDGCGNNRWVDSGIPCDSCVPSWVDTDTIRCTGANVETYQIDGCGSSRWHDTGTLVAWISNGEQQCGGGGTYLEPQINQCGMTRWFNTGVTCSEPCVPNWTNTGVIRCTGTNVENYQEDGCGNNQWVDSGTLVTWTNTGEPVCESGTLRQTQTNQCGTTRVVDTGVSCGGAIFFPQMVRAQQALPGATSVTARYQVDAFGTVYKVGPPITSLLHNWLVSGVASDYEVRMTYVSGIVFAGEALGTWLPMTSDRQWRLSHSGTEGNSQGTGLIECRLATTHEVVSSASITINAVLVDNN